VSGPEAGLAAARADGGPAAILAARAGGILAAPIR